MADGWQMPSFLSRLNEVLGGGEIGSIVAGAGSAMMAAGVGTSVAHYGVQATASALNNLRPANTAILVEQGRGASLG